MCQRCGTSFYDVNTLRSHEKLVHNMRSRTEGKHHPCDLCGKSFYDRSTLLRHVKNIHNTQKLECTICHKKQFKCQNYLEAHMKQCSTDKPVCHLCQQVFVLEGNLKRHLDMKVCTAHKLEYTCSVCGKECQNKSNFDIHSRKHTGETPFTCHLCGKSYSEKYKLDLHNIKIHIGKKTKQCEICSMLFFTRKEVTKHARTHTGEKPYQCQLCAKAFPWGAALKTHMRTHTGERPYECPICSKSFIQKTGLNRHMLTHTGLKPYICNICNKAFSQKENMKKHVLTHGRS